MNNRILSSIRYALFGSLLALTANNTYRFCAISYFGNQFVDDHAGKDEYVTCARENNQEVYPLLNFGNSGDDYCIQYRILCINEHPSQDEYASCDWKFIWTETQDGDFERRNACVQLNLTRSFNDACNTYIKSHFTLSLADSMILGVAAGLYWTRPRLSDIQILRRLLQNELVRQPVIPQVEEPQALALRSIVVPVAPESEAEPLLEHDERKSYGTLAARSPSN